MENGHAAQLSTIPFRLVFVELGIDRLEERAHKRDLECRTNNRTLQVKVFHCASLSYWSSKNHRYICLCKLTLVVDDSREKQSQERLPEGYSFEDRRDNATIIEHSGSRHSIGRGRGKAASDIGHGDDRSAGRAGKKTRRQARRIQFKGIASGIC